MPNPCYAEFQFWRRKASRSEPFCPLLSALLAAPVLPVRLCCLAPPAEAQLPRWPTRSSTARHLCARRTWTGGAHNLDPPHVRMAPAGAMQMGRRQRVRDNGSLQPISGSSPARSTYSATSALCVLAASQHLRQLEMAQLGPAEVPDGSADEPDESSTTNVPAAVPGPLVGGMTQADASALLNRVIQDFPVWLAALHFNATSASTQAGMRLHGAMHRLGYLLPSSSEEDPDSSEEGSSDDDLLPDGDVTLPNTYPPPVYPDNYCTGWLHPPPLTGYHYDLLCTCGAPDDCYVQSGANLNGFDHFFLNEKTMALVGGPQGGGYADSNRDEVILVSCRRSPLSVSSGCCLFPHCALCRTTGSDSGATRSPRRCSRTPTGSACRIASSPRSVPFGRPWMVSTRAIGRAPTTRTRTREATTTAR